MDKLQPLILESLQLLLIGMGTVFLILVMLIFLITMVSRFLASFPDKEIKHDLTPRVASSSATLDDTSQTELIAVISAAINTFKKRHSM